MEVRTLSRSRSGLKHAIGQDELAPVPTPQAMARADEVSVRQFDMEMVEALRTVHNDGFGSKLCCLCCPVADHEGRIRSFYERYPERLPMCGLAIRSDGVPLGYVQLAIHPMSDKDGLHTTVPGEAYIEQISVAAAARGKGVGKLLLQWAEDRARDHDSTILTLAVLNGNPALRLYERFGFQAVQADACDQCIGSCVVVCMVGRPYGLCHPHCGVTDMKKPLA